LLRKPKELMNMRDTYPARIMLAGAYSDLAGGSALTIPFHFYTATLRKTDGIPPGKEEEAARSAETFHEIFHFISALPGQTFHAEPDLYLFRENLHTTWMEMSIPAGCGLGRSGAVSAAIYEHFFPDAANQSLTGKKEDLAAVESYFHGKSSGWDALTCYEGSPLYFRPDGGIQAVDFHVGTVPGNYRFFLFDPGARTRSAPRVTYFLERMKDPGFAASIRDDYLPINQKLIEALLGLQHTDPALLFGVLSDFQFTHLREMIPEAAVDAWIEGQVSNEYYLKLHGSGGRFVLGITHADSMESINRRWEGCITWIN
jgi:mevalonate kinase